jgi:3-oxoadipate enol-lactonase
VTVHTRRVDVGEVELAVAEAGEGGRPLLLLHGFTGAKEDFTDWLDWLSDLGWHAVAPDHRGHGESSKPEGRDAYSLAILARDALRLADALGWDRFVLLGHSMGGYVAQRVTFESPARLAGLVLMDTGHGPVAGIEPEQVEWAGKIAVESGMDAMADLMAEVESPLETPAHRRLVAEQPAYAAFEDRKLRTTSPWLYASLSYELATCPDVLDQLVALTPAPPTLVVVGEQDAPFVPAAMRMAHGVPGATLGVVPDAGHSPQFENPAGWWQVVSAFLARIA